MEEKIKKQEKLCDEDLCLSAYPNGGLPETPRQMAINYGTYEIQATADTENQYPCIAQGYNPKIIRNDCENSHRGGKQSIG